MNWKGRDKRVLGRCPVTIYIALLSQTHLLVNKFSTKYIVPLPDSATSIVCLTVSTVCLTVSTGTISGPLRDDKSSDMNIFGRRERKKEVVRVPSSESYLAKTTDTTVSLSGAEVASRAIFLGHICSDLQKIVVVLNFSSATWPNKKSPHSSSVSYFDSYATPSNLELTVGKVNMRTFLRSDGVKLNVKFPS
jgi:hypothetical protein